jgi:methylated-DNA-[protein]-cysteine S-methyltransferase
MFYATMASCLGTIQLRSNGTHLTGVYFTDQKDCPRQGELTDAPASRPSPAAGTMHGMAIRNFKIYRPTDAGLFGHDAMAQAHAANSTSGGDHIAPDDAGLSLGQTDTPPAIRAVFRRAQGELNEYFAGKNHAFTVPLQLQGTEFQKRVWEALLTIPYGQYVSYGELAQRVGLEARHGRPVGTAVGRNPVSIIVPCHRVISGAGTLTGYTGGLERKVALLELEGFAFR